MEEEDRGQQWQTSRPAEGGRRVERPECYRADIGQRDAARLSQQRIAFTLDSLPRSAAMPCGVTLGKLDMAVTLLHGKVEILTMHVVLLIDKSLVIDAGMFHSGFAGAATISP